MSNYPTKLDTDLQLPPAQDNVTEVTADSFNGLRDAILAVETAVGVNPQGNTINLVDRINVSLDANGNIRNAALLEAGFIALPIAMRGAGTFTGRLSQGA